MRQDLPRKRQAHRQIGLAWIVFRIWDCVQDLPNRWCNHNLKHKAQRLCSIAVISAKFKHRVLYFLRVEKKVQCISLFLGMISLSCIAGCTSVAPAAVQPPPPPTVAVPAFVTAAPDQALPQLVEAERQASIDKNLALLAQLWAEDGRIVDGRDTLPTADDYVWEGRAALLDRYVVAVFANPPPPLQLHGALLLQVTGDTATGRYGQDRWRFVKRANRWWLAELRYSQP